MDKILSIQTIKNVFGALGAKTSDSNYGVALLDKTTAEPKGLMGMSDLASVLGVWPDVTTPAINQINANTLHLQGVHFYSFNNITLDYNFPETNYGCSLLTIFRNTSVGFQLCYSYSRKLYFRGLWSADENQWSAWEEL